MTTHLTNSKEKKKKEKKEDEEKRKSIKNKVDKYYVWGVNFEDILNTFFNEK